MTKEKSARKGRSTYREKFMAKQNILGHLNAGTGCGYRDHRHNDRLKQQG